MPNALARATSPYLRQHADNPVDWVEWSPEVIARAVRENKPILLSIGYSACHWCHVMAHESFEDATIAKQMNDGFVCIKVDREERPDLDQIYQLCVQIMGRSGGWPLTVFLTPDTKPFFAGTYFPSVDKYGMPGFPRILEAVLDAYKTKRDEIDAQAGELTTAIASMTAIDPKEDRSAIDKDVIDLGAREMSKRFDDVNGGFGTRPKFPNTMALEVLLRRGLRDDEFGKKCRERVAKAIDGMISGGICDHLGGGFARYSTDEKWLVPHFEKMLYDNALLLRLFAQAGVALEKQRWSHGETRDLRRYIEREMTDADGAFFSAQDADSREEGSPDWKHAEEGAFFVWTKAQVEEAVGNPEIARVACAMSGVEDHGNFEDSDASVLSFRSTHEEVGKRLGLTSEQVVHMTNSAIPKLFERREERPKPFRDEKVLTSWNALMISGVIEAAFARQGDLRAPNSAMAIRAYDAIDKLLIVRNADDLRVLRSAPPRNADGTRAPATIPGFLDDYAYLANAALSLYALTGLPRYAFDARAIADAAIRWFLDEKDGGFFFSPSDGEALIHRSKDAFDHAIPSGVAVLCEVLLQLHSLTGEARYEEIARATLTQLAPTALKTPLGMSQVLLAIDRLQHGSVDVVIVSKTRDPAIEALRGAAGPAWVRRNLVTIVMDEPETIAAAPALAKDKPAHDRPVAYVCRDRTCSAPVSDPIALATMLREAR
ncbi:MAG: thioredoxin domain-containing protein [Polyangiales bacterium]